MPAQFPKNNANPAQISRRRGFLPWHSLTWQLVILTILPLTLLVLVIAFGGLAIHQNAMRSLVGERDERAVRMMAAALENQANHQEIVIHGLSRLAENSSPDELDKILASSDYLLPEFDAGLAFFNQAGMLAGAIGDRDLWENLAGQIASIVPPLLAESESTIFLSSAFKHPVSGEPLVVILAGSPKRDWVAAGASSAAGMVRHSLAYALENVPQLSVILVDNHQQLLYQSDSFSFTGEIRSYPGVTEALRGESGTTYKQMGRSEHVVAYCPIAPMGWALVLEEPWEMVETPILRASQMAPLVLVPVLVLAVIALWFGARQIVKPLQTLESRAAMLAWGDFKTIEKPVGGIEEIRQLQSELTHMSHKVQAAQQSLHGYIGAITTAQEEERRRLARELHDDTIQALIALKQRVQLTQHEQHTATESASLQEIASVTEQTIENLRRLTRALRPIYLEDLGLVTALEMLARETGQATDIPVEFQRQGVEMRLEPVTELALYRMAQEALNNIARHAQATQASLKIDFTAQAVTIEITDNGKGFEVPKSPAEFAPSSHYGLLGLYERAELIGAILEIHSAPGQGTHLIIRVPLL